MYIFNLLVFYIILKVPRVIGKKKTNRLGEPNCITKCARKYTSEKKKTGSISISISIYLDKGYKEKRTACKKIFHYIKILYMQNATRTPLKAWGRCAGRVRVLCFSRNACRVSQ